MSLAVSRTGLTFAGAVDYLAPPCLSLIFADKQELAEIVDELSGKVDVRSGLGMTGLLTNGVLPRANAYVEGVIFALCPFVGGAQYWD